MVNIDSLKGLKNRLGLQAWVGYTMQLSSFSYPFIFFTSLVLELLSYLFIYF